MSKKNKISYLYLAAFICAFLSVAGSSLSAQTLINELDINPPSVDQPCEYIELKGMPGAVLNNLYFVAIEGDGAAAGTADYVYGFSNQPIGSNGILVITATTACGSRTYPAATTRIQDSTLDGSNGLENGTISFLLINSPTTAIVEGIDYDTNNDGTPDALPSDATILDAVAWTDGGAGDINYGGVVLTTGGTPDAATRFPNNTNANSVAAWYAGDLTGADNSSTIYSETNRTDNFPANGALTPGDVNAGKIIANVDFNGDGKSDYVVTRSPPALGNGQLFWYINASGSNEISVVPWGIFSDTRTPADFDGDGKTDIAVWRSSENPGESAFYILQSLDNTLRVEPFGQTSDDARVVADYDGDGKADPAVYRKNSGQNFFYYRGSLNNPNGDITYVPWGSSPFIRPNVGDYDNDGKADFCVFTDQDPRFILLRSSDLGVEYISWGIGSDTLVPGDFDGDGKADFCVVRNDGGQLNWYILQRDGRGTGASPISWGTSTDFFAPGDYDGDGKQDVAVWRPSEGIFYVRQSSDNSLQAFKWGTSGDNSTANWYIHTGGIF